MNRKAIYTALALSSLAFAFFWLPAPRAFDIACIFLILIFVPAALIPTKNELIKDPLIQLGILFFLYIVFSIIWHRLTLPESFPNTTSDRRFLRTLYFIAIAYSIAKSRILTAWQLLATAFAGLLVYLLINFDQAEWSRAWQGQRADFGIHNAQHTGVVFATSALAFASFTPRFFYWIKNTAPALKLSGTLLWSGALLFCLWGVFVSQTRAVWLGLSITMLFLPSVLFLAYRLRGKAQSPLRKFIGTSFAGILLLGLLATGFNFPSIVSERLAAEEVTWESLRLAASHESQELSSIEIRVASWSAATDWIKERPFMGWGGRGSRPLIQQSELFSDTFKKSFNHLHNSYFQVLVEIGFVGASFIIALIILAGRACITSYQRNLMPLDVFVFSWAFFIFWLVVNLFESYIIFSSGTFLVALVGGTFYSFCIKKRVETE